MQLRHVLFAALRFLLAAVLVIAGVLWAGSRASRTSKAQAVPDETAGEQAKEKVKEEVTA